MPAGRGRDGGGAGQGRHAASGTEARRRGRERGDQPATGARGPVARPERGGVGGRQWMRDWEQGEEKIRWRGKRVMWSLYIFLSILTSTEAVLPNVVLKRLQLHQKSRSTKGAGAGAVLSGAGALPNGPLVCCRLVACGSVKKSCEILLVTHCNCQHFWAMA
jgi:hypothetical protein